MTTPTNEAPVTVDLIEAARRIYRTLEMSAGIMRDPGRNGGWEGAERTASAFERQAIAAKSLHDRLAALASAPAGDGYGKWHPMLLDLVDAIHRDRGEKTQAIGIDLSYQQALAAALARPRAAVGEVGLLEQARDAIKDMLRDDDGQAWKEARKLLPRLDAALQSPPAKEKL